MTGAVHVSADAELRARLELLLPDDDARTHAAIDDALARVVWSRLVEPADAVAGSLITALGAGPAIDLLVNGADPRRISDAVHEASGSELDARRIGAGLKRWLPRLDRAATLNDLDRGIAAGMRLIEPSAITWPERLNDLGEHAPLLLWVRGDPAHLSAASLAVVGARACTGYGTHTTAELSDAACAAGVTIVSGAAYGIDAVAHRTALGAETPTVAVVAGGADRPYPMAHAQLLDRIAASGAICAEMVPGSAPTRWRFLMRNRIIAALGIATLVTEAGARSGSLNTAGNAAELGRPLGAVPGPITSASSAGCHRLIREYDAALITSSDDLRELLGFEESSGASGSTRTSPLHRRVLDALPLRGSRSVADTARHAGLPPDETRAALAELELLGSVSRSETPDEPEVRWSLQRRE